MEVTLVSPNHDLAKSFLPTHFQLKGKYMKPKLKKSVSQNNQQLDLTQTEICIRQY
jgi:hypothetical protein